MAKNIFRLHSKFHPSGDQPQAIKKLVEGIKGGDRYQTLLGVTGSGKTFTMASVISHFNMPVLVIAPNKVLAAQLYREYKNFFPGNSVNYFVSYYDYYQPEAYMPTSDTYIEKEAMINEEIDRLRHQATSALLSRKDVIIVASVSCIYNLGVPLNYLGASLHLEVGKPITRGDLIRQLVKMQFARTGGALKRSSFRVRGDAFEIIPASGNVINYIEITNQKIKNIALRDPLTGKFLAPRTSDVFLTSDAPRQKRGSPQAVNIEREFTERRMSTNLNEIVVFPPKHFISNEPQREAAIKEIQKELKERLAYFEKNKLYLEAERLQRRTKYDIEMLRSIGYCHGIENYSRHLSGKLAGEPPDTLLAYLASRGNTRNNTQKNAEKIQRNSALSPRVSADSQKLRFLTIIDESHMSIPQIRGMYEGDRSRKEVLVEYGWRLPSALDNRPLKFDEFKQKIGQTIFTSATPGQFELKHSSQAVKQVIRPTGLIDPPIEVRPIFKLKTSDAPNIDVNIRTSAVKKLKVGSLRNSASWTQVDDIMAEIKILAQKGERAIINTLTKKMAEDLHEFLTKKGFKANYMHSDTKTLDRARILTDFRQGKFDVLIGVNLLREGLDLPEVTLVAILDADREGFLRSETSLIQTMGRCARNVRGKVILYADNITGSMKRAIKEVKRRRKLQMEYNKKRGITPKTIEKEVEELLQLEES